LPRSWTFRETLLLHDFSLPRCGAVAGEFCLLEDSLRVRLRVQLYEIFYPLGEKLRRRHRQGLPLEAYDLAIFRRLFLFFLCLEHYWPSPLGKVMRDKFIPLSREVVWPALGQPWPENLLQDLESPSLAELTALLAAKLTDTLAQLHLLN